MMMCPQWRNECRYTFNIHNSSLDISGLDADEDPVRADCLHCPYDILIGDSRCFSSFRLSREEDEIVHGDDALEHPVFIHDRESSNFFSLHGVQGRMDIIG